MHDILSNATFFGVMVSILSYELGLFIKKKTQSPICNPLLISIIVTIGVLLLLHIDYKSYNAGAQYLSYLLTPATVCLAIPLYEQLSLLVRNVKAILIGIIAGVLASIGSGFGLCLLPPQDVFCAQLFHTAHPRQQAVDPRHIHRPGLPPVREKIRHGLLHGIASGAPGQQGFRDAAAQQQSGTHGPQQALMPRHGNEIRPQFPQLQRQAAR